MKIATGKLALVLALGTVTATAARADKDLNLGLDFNTIIGGQDVQSGDPVLANTVLIVGQRRRQHLHLLRLDHR